MPAFAPSGAVFWDGHRRPKRKARFRGTGATRSSPLRASMVRTHPFAKDGDRPKPHASEGVTPTRHTGHSSGQRQSEPSWPGRPTGKCRYTRFRTGRRSFPIDGLAACLPALCRRHTPFRFEESPVRRPVAGMIEARPCSPWLKGGSEPGFAGLPPGVSRRVCSACRFRRFGTMWQRWMHTDEPINTIMPTRSVVRLRAGYEPSPSCCRSMPCGPVDVDDPEGSFAAHVTRRKGRGPATATATGQAGIRRSISRSSWPIS